MVIDGVIRHTLFVTNDNDFLPGMAGDNKFYVFAASDADLASVGATYTAQMISPVPEPETYALMLSGLGMVGWLARRKRTVRK